MKKRELKGSLCCFFYLLGRDHLPLGKVEQIVMDVEKALGDADSVIYSNGYLANYASNLAQRIHALDLCEKALSGDMG